MNGINIQLFFQEKAKLRTSAAIDMSDQGRQAGGVWRVWPYPLRKLSGSGTDEKSYSLPYWLR
jgi:hypothetical protein